MKEVEKKFFKFCMKHLEHYDNRRFDNDAGEYVIFRKDYIMWECMNDFCEKYDVPFKVIYAISMKWDNKGIFTWEGDMWGVFHPQKFPIEYMLLVPSRTIRKCGFLYGKGIVTSYKTISFIKKNLENCGNASTLNEQMLYKIV